MSGELPSSSNVDIVRPYDPSSDETMFKMIVGQGVMEGLANANNKTITHPLVIALLLLIGAAIDHYFSFYPHSSAISYLSPLKGPCFAFLPALGLVEFLHRPVFTARLRKTVGSIDMVKPEIYYQTEPSGIWVFQHKGEVVGTVCLDASENAGKELDSVLGEEEGRLGKEGIADQLLPKARETTKPGLRKRSVKPKTAISQDVAQIRHLDVDQPWRRSGVGSELLFTALDHGFSISSSSSPRSSITRVIAHTNPLSSNSAKLLTKCGFRPVPAAQTGEDWEESERLGLLQWAGEWMSVDKETWIAKRAVFIEKASGR